MISPLGQNHGASMGEGYGPRIVAREPLTRDDLAGKRVGSPGEWTSAHLALRLFQPEAVPTPMAFDRILVSVGRVPNGDRIGNQDLLVQDREDLLLP